MSIGQTAWTSKGFRVTVVGLARAGTVATIRYTTGALALVPARTLLVRA